MYDSPISVQSWCDLYSMLHDKAAARRGAFTVTPSDAPSITFPRTTVRDAFAIALVFDKAVNDHASGHVVARWIWESDRLAGESEDSVDAYVGNPSFWQTLATSAIELDRVHALLPSQSLIDDAVRELETVRDVPQDPPRSTEGTMLVTVFTEKSWKAMAVRQLEFFSVLHGQVPGNDVFVPAVPCTCNADILELARYWTDQLALIDHNASDTYHRLVHSCWREVLHRVMRHAKRAPAQDTYVHNAEFWSTLLLLTTQTDACDARPTPWAFHVPAPGGHHRNAAAVDTGATLEFPAAKTWDEAAKMQRDAFAELRGEDRVTGRLIARVPRTTVADVRQLAAYWSVGLAKVGEHSFADVSYRHVIERWKAAVAEIERLPPSADPSAVYAHNTEFWEALMTIAIQVAVTAETPTRWQLVKEATKQAIADLPQTIQDLPQTLKTAAQDLVNGVLAKPLVYIGVGLGGLALAIFLLRRSGHESKS